MEGAILRSAWVTGAKTALFAPGTVDAYGPKVVRTGYGRTLSLPFTP
ncbi:MAG: hypothetical protein AB1566_11155 [Chloroflexota bacterium]